MGGQACVFYGAAEFSRDVDLAILLQQENIDAFAGLIRDLDAERIAVPPFEWDYLERGHAVHFRCQHPEAERVRIDVMAVMRGVDPFPELWKRRSTFETPEGDRFELLGLPDLVMAKKTQRDKDWPMIRRLVDVNYLEARHSPTVEQIDFWLRELRTPDFLIEAAASHGEEATRLIAERAPLRFARDRDSAKLSEALHEEELLERERDRDYWAPLRREMEDLRRSARTKG